MKHTTYQAPANPFAGAIFMWNDIFLISFSLKKMIFEIFARDLGFAENNDNTPATLKQYKEADRAVIPLFQSIRTGDIIVLAEGQFEVDIDLDPITEG